MIVENDPDSVALVDLNRWTGGTAVVSPKVDGSAGDDFLLHGLGDEMEDLAAAFNDMTDRLKAMYRDIVALGSDVDARGGIRTGSVLIGEMTIAGE